MIIKIVYSLKAVLQNVSETKWMLYIFHIPIIIVAKCSYICPASLIY